MSYLTGEFECKLDNKGRMMIPAGLKKQLPAAESEGLVIIRGFEKYLVIYTKKDWVKKLDELSKLNQYDTKNLQFIRTFTRGSTELMPDSTGRVNLPQGLLDYAEIKGDLVLNCQLSWVEVWNPTAYQKKLNTDEMEDFADMARLVMGDKGKEGAA
jgi:MraZ protein